MTARTNFTLEQFLEMSKPDAICEFIEGQAVPKVSPKAFHSMLTFTLTLLLRQTVKSQGRVYLEWAIKLKRQGEDWAPVPEVTYVSYERLPKSWKRNEACPVPPELVIEIISPGQNLKDFEDKAKDYFAAGVLRVWVVDPEGISITVLNPDGTSLTYTNDVKIVEPLLPGWELTTQQIFEEAELL
jgi:Uma2 family endonuclease